MLQNKKIVAGLLILVLIGWVLLIGYLINMRGNNLRQQAILTPYSDQYKVLQARLSGATDVKGARVNIPVFPSMMELDEDGFLALRTDKAPTGEWSVWCDSNVTTVKFRYTSKYHAIECEPFRGDGKGAGEPFLITEEDLQRLFHWGATLAY